MFTERAERAKKELSPLMQEIRKYIPQAEYGYHVESGEYPAFYGVRIEFTYNGIRFHVCKIYKENKYRIAADMEHFEYVNRYDIERAGNQYDTQIYRQVEQENVENSKKVADFLKSIENEPVRWEGNNHSKGTIIRNGLRFTFYIEEGHLYFELSLSYRGTADYDTFRLIADNRYIPKGNY